MKKTLMEVSCINFSYRLVKNRSGSIRHLIRDAFAGRIEMQKINALKDISFDLKQGEILALIGKNGAGKSTLLKIVAGILSPTSGKLKVTGTVAPMIELGAGFHPEMTAAENVEFLSTLLGRSSAEIKSSIAPICEWAGVSDQMEFPIRTFSSGMLARLAFSTSTYFETEILLIDEILSVGDQEFQHKSKGRIQEMIQNGTSIILVTHDLGEVLRIATRVIWIDHGQIIAQGDPSEIVERYRLAH
jgi:ABC-2 type transport system ATP-binding protein